MTTRRIVIAGTGSGVGKTTLTIGLMSAFKQKGYEVQGFKCGPDYIDPTYHSAVTGRKARNLDTWMLPHEVVKEIVGRGSVGADLSIIEGVMGFYDGKNPLTDEGTTAEISVITETPVILVVNGASMARSAAAIVKGFQMFSDQPTIIGVIVNQVGSQGHYELIKAAVEQECNLPVFGYLQKNAVPSIPERHLGLVPSIERGDLDSFFEQLGKAVSETVELDEIYARSIAPSLSSTQPLFINKGENRVRIAVARDAAFNFYYEENLELLEAYGADLVYFSPLKGEKLPPGVDGLYIGGGFPEEFARELSQQTEVKQSIKEAIEDGLPTLAECGGFMYLTDAIVTREGTSYEMLGLINGKVKMQDRLAALGYREIRGGEGNYLLMDGDVARGHEFHYSTFEAVNEHPHAYEVIARRKVSNEGTILHNVIAGYTHIHFASCPKLIENWIKRCEERNDD
ncbi:cobyrinate a,c-diamide synthase [Priestia koreensis]|uniref:Cobyrinate a,c-diamide synthase n=1 Tax=Priestia koreensis TaxID=284581 RepID=A0A0M0L6R0_9BACI|nr:cobyrinate a,c-diamide synthase [Priestia koreensis]KOO46542.1 cobyrinic acid a,c-diamide synthase [Priestia koreensis]